MSTNNRLNYKNFTIATAITFVVAAVVLYLSFSIGKDELFLLLNDDLGKAGDFFFNYATHLGDGLLWVVWVLAMLTTKRRHLLPLLVSAIAFTTLFTQVGKQYIYPDELRPSEAMKITMLGLQRDDEVRSINGVKVVYNQDVFKQLNKLKAGDSVLVVYSRGGINDTVGIKWKKESHLHLVDGITVHTYNSFPSGHTATAFAFALLIAVLVPSTLLTLVCVAAALLVGYTRIYLGQHFPIDVAGGMIVAAVSITLSVFIQRWFDRRARKSYK